MLVYGIGTGYICIDRSEHVDVKNKMAFDGTIKARRFLDGTKSPIVVGGRIDDDNDCE